MGCSRNTLWSSSYPAVHPGAGKITSFTSYFDHFSSNTIQCNLITFLSLVSCPSSPFFLTFLSWKRYLHRSSPVGELGPERLLLVIIRTAAPARLFEAYSWSTADRHCRVLVMRRGTRVSWGGWGQQRRTHAAAWSLGSWLQLLVKTIRKRETACRSSCRSIQRSQTTDTASYRIAASCCQPGNGVVRINVHPPWVSWDRRGCFSSSSALRHAFASARRPSHSGS